MEHVDVTPVTAEKPRPNSPVVYEVSPDSSDEQIVEIEVSGLNDDEPAQILTFSADKKDVRRISDYFLVGPVYVLCLGNKMCY